VAELPVLDRLNTRHLESRQLVRGCVKQAEVLEADRAGLLLSTRAVASRANTRWPAAGEADPEARWPGDGQVTPGRLRIDLLSDSILRVRYAEGEQIPENRTPMLMGHFDGPSSADVSVVGDEVRCETAEVRVRVGLTPLSLRIDSRDGRELCRIGGDEPNHFQQWDSYNTGICRTAVDGSPVGVECFHLRPREAIYGMGEQFLKLDKVGQTIDLNMLEALGIATPRSYKNIPFFSSVLGYGVFFNHSSRMTVWLGTLHAARIQVAVEDDFLDYFLILGDLKQILSRYTDITGKGQVPPRWSFGYWQSKISYQSAEETLDIARNMREADLPLDVIHLDTHWFKRDWYCDLEFDPERFPDPASYLRQLRELGVKVSLWQLPYIPEGSRLFRDLAAVNGFVKDARGEIYDVGVCMVAGFEGVVGCVDYTNPEACRVHGEHFRRLFELGVSAIKVDFGEQAPLDGVYSDGTPGHRAHNLYPLLYNRTIFEVTEAATGEGIIWARSAWAGSQRYPLHWGGDSSCNWDNLIPQIEGGLSFGLSGFQFWSQDIGGFVGTTGGSLLIRWMQAGLFLSHARIHGFGDRELYKLGPEVLRICRDYLHLRYRLLPYLWGTAADCVERSLPMARALVVEYPSDPNVWSLGDQWLLGDWLLVAPIADDTNARRVYLPEGGWIDWWCGERLEGPRWIGVEAGLETLPLYLREGAIVPMGPAMGYVDEFPAKEITLRVAPFRGEGESHFRFPVNGEAVSARYTSTGGSHRLEIAPSPVRFRVEVVGREAPSVELRSAG
jgi:alpha-D-xyloside xylohydrolase